MRLAYLASRYPGTSQVFVQREVRGLRALGVDVVTVSVRRSPEVLSATDREEAESTLWLVPPGPLALVRAHLRAALRPGAWLGTLAGALRDAPARRRAMQVMYWGEAVLLWDLLRRRDIAHIHVHFANNASDIALIAARLGRRTGAGPQSFSIHLHGPTDFIDVQRSRIALKVAEASGVIAISDYARAQTLACAPPEAAARVHVARYGAPAPFPRAPREPGGPLRVLNVGRLADVKGQAILIEALRRAVQAGADLELDIVGDGPLRAELEAAAGAAGLADRIRFHGALGSDALSALWSTADVFCLPSLAEGLPVVLLEAMAAGLPIVATAITGVPEAVRDDREGLLVAPSDPDALAGALERLARDPQLRERLGQAGLERATGELSQERSLAGIRDALRAVVPAG